MSNTSSPGLFIFSAVVLLIIFGMVGIGLENNRIQRKCLVEMEDKPFKEATEICKERVK